MLLAQQGLGSGRERTGPSCQDILPCSCPTWTRLTICRLCVSSPKASSSWKTVSITCGEAGICWFLGPTAGSHPCPGGIWVCWVTQEPSTAQLCCPLSLPPFPYPLHLPDDTLEGQLCPRAMGVPQQQGHAVAKGNQGQLGSCQLQDLFLVGETNPARQGQQGTASMAQPWHSQHGADGPGSRGWGQATEKGLGLSVPVLYPSGKHHRQSGSSPGVREGDNIQLSPIPA